MDTIAQTHNDKCPYIHHAGMMPTMDKCNKHDKDRQCGPFYHAICLDCDKNLALKCNVCQKATIDCYC